MESIPVRPSIPSIHALPTLISGLLHPPLPRKSGMLRTGLGALSWTCAPLPPHWNMSTKGSCSLLPPNPSALTPTPLLRHPWEQEGV